MRIIVLILIFTTTYGNKNTYNFYRNMQQSITTRRVFGGNSANLQDFPAVCLLADKSKRGKCSGTIITLRFVITAGHCIDPKLKYVVYNTRSPVKFIGDSAEISNLYRHPGYNAVIEDEGRGLDVTKLYHDVGLVRTSDNMHLAFPSKHQDHLQAMRTLPTDIENLDVNVLGFGTLDSSSGAGEELMSINLRLQPCLRSTWEFCVCASSMPGARSAGVCVGDSGGPLVFNGTLLGVTSMGPRECSTGDELTPGANNVFTLVSNYLDLIDSTINSKDAKVRMSELKLNRDSGAPAPTILNAIIIVLPIILKLLE